MAVYVDQSDPMGTWVIRGVISDDERMVLDFSGLNPTECEAFQNSLRAYYPVAVDGIVPDSDMWQLVKFYTRVIGHFKGLSERSGA